MPYPYGSREMIDGRIDEDHIRIIGVEFTIDTQDGQNEEIEMYTPSGLLIIPKSRGGYFYAPRITFHTTIGDHTIGGRNNNGWSPW
jgi:hypothetical protein